MRSHRPAVAVLALSLIASSCSKTPDAPAIQGPGPNTRCLPSGDQRERAVFAAFVEAYNQGDVSAARDLADLDELWDPAGAPHHHGLRIELDEWIAAGARVNDHLEVVELCVYPGEGADGNLLRRNDLLVANQLAPLAQSVKIAIDRDVMKRLVIYMPDGQERDRFCTVFRDAVRAAEQVERPPAPQC